MALDFPASPALGATFAGPQDIVWTWDGMKWTGFGSAGLFLPISGGTMTGPLVLSANASAALQPVTLQQLQAGWLPLTGGTLTGALTVGGNGISYTTAGSYLHAIGFGWDGSSPRIYVDGVYSATLATQAYVGIVASGYLPLTGGSLSGTLSVAGNGIRYPANGPQYIGFSWDSSIASLSLTVDGTFMSYLTRSPNAGGYTGIYQIGFNPGNSTVVGWLPGSTVLWPVTPSDRRLKENLAPATIDALDIINRIKIYETDMKSLVAGGTSTHWDCAIIADEIEPLVPAAFIAAPEGETAYESVRDLPLICTMLRAMQQMNARLEAVEAQSAGGRHA